MICIVGRSGSGKDYLANEFERFGYKILKSYTTRPKRFENEDTHIFISKEEANKIVDKMAVTEINGYEYFSTISQVKENDIYIIDPEGLKTLTKSVDNKESIYVIYVFVDGNIRKEKAINRNSNTEQEIIVFNNRNDSENEQFTEFERHIGIHNNGVIPFANNYNSTSIIPNCISDYDLGNSVNIIKCNIFHNNYNEIDAKRFVLHYLGAFTMPKQYMR
jgi:dephospho-CoA kinase